MSPDVVSVVQSALKYIFIRSSDPDPTGGPLTAPLDPIRLVKMEEVSPGTATFRVPVVAEKIKQIVHSSFY